MFVMVAWGQQATEPQGLAGEGNVGSYAWLTVCLFCLRTVRVVPGTLVPS